MKNKYPKTNKKSIKNNFGQRPEAGDDVLVPEYGPAAIG
jgi:hypothetical protein